MRKTAVMPSKIGDILGQSSRRFKICDRTRDWRLCKRWPDIVGTTVAEHAWPLRFSGRCLIVRVDHPAWMQELGYLSTQLIEGILKAMPDSTVNKIRYEVGPLPAAHERARRNEAHFEKHELNNDEKQFIEQAAVQISDPEIRDAARSAMLKGFSVRRQS